MFVPESFEKRLKELFNDRLRIRWSAKKHEFHIENKCGRAVLPPVHIDDGDDDLIRAADGYEFVLSVRAGTSMPCPECGMALDVPAFRFAEVVCDYCRIRGRDGRHVAGYFPLGEKLLDHLKKIDPYLGWRDGEAAKADERNKQLLASRERAYSNHIEATTKDHWNRLVGIPQTGYTGKERHI